MTAISITGFQSVPPFAQGLVRDLRVRWALHEAGMDYDVDTITFDQRQSTEHLRRNPFGQVPTAEIGSMGLFESGAILYALGLRSPALMAGDEPTRLRTLAWMFSALNTIEQPLWTVFKHDMLVAEEARSAAFRAAIVDELAERLSRLANTLAAQDYLVGGFSVADILMATTLRFLRHTDIVTDFVPLAAYLARCEARPAFKSALAEQQSGYDAALLQAA
jgi:glutathione S-transferase